MMRLLGIEEEWMQQAPAHERSLYRMAALLFMVSAALCLVGDAYFGWMMMGSGFGIALMSSLMGYIHIAVLRMATITLISLPVVEKKAQEDGATGIKRWVGKVTFLLDGAFWLRWTFVAGVAFTVAFPAAALLHHGRCEELQQQHGSDVLAQLKLQGIAVAQWSATDRLEILEARYPFYVLEQLSSSKSFLFMVLLLALVILLPLGILNYLKWKGQYVYTQLASEKLRDCIRIDYQETMDKSQWWLKEHYPFFKKDIVAMEPYADAPFNTELKNKKQRIVGSTEEWKKWRSEGA
jgi:hypothetical protein